MRLEIKTLDADRAGEIDLPDVIYGLTPRADILHRMVRYQLLKRMAGTHKALGRAEINRTGKKSVKQKGSGGARHGSKRAPQFRGGGKSHGPLPRSHAIDLPKKVRALALRLALSAKATSGTLMVLDRAELPEPKTAHLIEKLHKLGVSSALIISGAEVDRNFGLAARSIPHVDVLPVQGINVYDILRRDTLVLTRGAVDAISARFDDVVNVRPAGGAK